MSSEILFPTDASINKYICVDVEQHKTQNGIKIVLRHFYISIDETSSRLPFTNISYGCREKKRGIEHTAECVSSLQRKLIIFGGREFSLFVFSRS